MRWNVDECKPLVVGDPGGARGKPGHGYGYGTGISIMTPVGRGLHSSTFYLDLSRFLHKTHP